MEFTMSFREFLPYTPYDGNYFQQTLGELIQYSAGLIQVGVDGETMAPEYSERARNAVNLAVLEMQAKGLHLSSYKLGYLFLNPNQGTYIIEDENATNQYYQRTLSADEATGQTVLSISDTDDLENDDTIGIILDDGSIQWTTVVSYDSVLLTVTVADALTDDAASGNYIFNYRVALKQISRIHQILRRDNYVNDVPLTIISQQEWNTLNNKRTATGLPNQMYYQRTIPKGTLKMWPVPQNSYSIVWFWYEQKLGQMKDMTDVMDLDQFYYPAFAYLVAVRLCDVFAASSETKMSIQQTYNELLADAMRYDDEGTPIKISPNRRV
jgi:hypothetical protein